MKEDPVWLLTEDDGDFVRLCRKEVFGEAIFYETTAYLDGSGKWRTRPYRSIRYERTLPVRIIREVTREEAVAIMLIARKG